MKEKILKIIRNVRMTTSEAKGYDVEFRMGYTTAINNCIDAINKNDDIASVSSSALNEGEKMHYESLQECCNKILDAVDAGKVPQRAIMGLRLLMNR